MCGIIGVAQTGQLERDKLITSLTHLRHRGPDDAGEWLSADQSVWLGQRRLAIVDLSEAGRQPMPNEDRTIWLVCNGEIYNYPRLRKRLEGLGHFFYSNSDSEVILHAYEVWGEQCVDYLEGMFAFILWDDNRQKLLAARDRVGIKPLCYAQTGQGLMLASDMRALLPLLPDKPSPAPLALAYVMTLGYVPAPWSIWQGICKLEPGYLLTWQPQSPVQTHCYWEPPREINETPDAHWQSRFETVLQEHLLSDVPIGLFLSGGLDSTAIAAGLHDLKQTVTAITISFPGSERNETPVAIDVAKHLAMSHSVIPIETTDVNQLIEQVVRASDEPQSYSALLSMYRVSQIAVQKVKVVLAGDGGDEIFGGYKWYQDLEEQMSLRRAARLLRRALRPTLSGEINFVKRSPLHQHVWRLHPRFLPQEAETLLAPMKLRFGEEEMLAPLHKHFEPNLPLKRALQRVDLMNFCTDSILAKVDRASMAHSLEVRVPFLDHRLIEWALTRPVEARESKNSKPVLRDYLRPRVPASVLNHPKQGFSLPVLNGYDWQAALQTIQQSFWVQEGYWSSGWEKFLAIDGPYRPARIWNLLILSRWAEVWLRGGGIPGA